MNLSNKFGKNKKMLTAIAINVDNTCKIFFGYNINVERIITKILAIQEFLENDEIIPNKIIKLIKAITNFHPFIDL